MGLVLLQGMSEFVHSGDFKGDMGSEVLFWFGPLPTAMVNGYFHYY